MLIVVMQSATSNKKDKKTIPRLPKVRSKREFFHSWVSAGSVIPSPTNVHPQRASSTPIILTPSISIPRPPHPALFWTRGSASGWIGFWWLFGNSTDLNNTEKHWRNMEE
jgi:hypothetical protein